MITITYKLDVDVNIEDLPPDGISIIQQLVTQTLGKAMVPIKNGIIDGTVFKRSGIKSTGKLRNKT